LIGLTAFAPYSSSVEANGSNSYWALRLANLSSSTGSTGISTLLWINMGSPLNAYLESFSYSSKCYLFSSGNGMNFMPLD